MFIAPQHKVRGGDWSGGVAAVRTFPALGLIRNGLRRLAVIRLCLMSGGLYIRAEYSGGLLTLRTMERDGMATIALVDDDQNILASVAMALEAEGFTVVQYTDGASALAALVKAPADLGVFDIKMPRMDGMELLRRLRQEQSFPVIFLTSKDDEIDEVLGLKMGADDYIRKPFSQRLLIERIRAVLRRAEANKQPQTAEEAGNIMVRGRLRLDPVRHLCEWGNEAIDLTVTEFLIIQALAQRPGYVKSREQLMDMAYADDVYVDDRTIDSHIKRLRKKFRVIDDEFKGIETLYGVGYRFREE